MRVRRVALIVALTAAVPAGARSLSEPCVPTPRPPGNNPAFASQERTFGFHDEELVLCSDGGGGESIHIAARLWVPTTCPGEGGCPGVVIGHGFGFNKEVTFADMYQAVQRGLYVLSYDVRGQGLSGGQATFLARQDVADQAAVLRWWHENVRPTRTAFYGLSQGGWLSWSAAVFNCGAARAATFDSTVPCDGGGRWIDAIAPVQGPTRYLDDGTCPLFSAEALVYSRFNPALAGGLVPCLTEARPGTVAGIFEDVSRRLDRIDVPVYAVTSFYDRIVLPQLTTEAYELLHARTLDQADPMFGKDVRLTISNDGHGAVGGNFAVIGDVFDWIEHQIDDGPPLRAAPVAIAAEWDAGRFRLEDAWPIPGTTATLFLGRDSAGGRLDGSTNSAGADELRNVPVLASPPEVPFLNTAVAVGDAGELPGMRLVYATAALAQTTEIAGQPAATIWVHADEPGSDGQLHLFLGEATPDGSVHAFSQGRLGLTGLGPTPVAVTIPLSVAAHRVDAGNRLVLMVAPSDVAVVIPARGVTPFFVDYGEATPSSITFPVVPVDRPIPPGEPPSGAAFTDDPLGAICTALTLPC